MRVIRIGVIGLAVFLTSQSAIIAKRSGISLPLVMVDVDKASTTSRDGRGDQPQFADGPRVEGDAAPPGDTDLLGEAQIRYFDGRPVRPARVMWMRVTAYSPDEKSCGLWADGRTATNHSVWTNAMELVAADTGVLPFGSLVSLPGYAQGRIVPVLDRGGAIKGSRLDVLYPTHQRALEWGVRDLPVIVWKYADEDAPG